MAYNNQFNINKYFEVNYGLGYKPAKYKFGKKSFLILILFCWIWIPLYIIKTIGANKKIKEWEEAFEYRRTNWWKEYNKALAKAEKDLNVKASAFKRLGLMEGDPDLDSVKPILLHGLKFDGYWRVANDGTYRTSKHEYTYIIFKKDQVLFYVANIDLLEASKKKENTLEFFYSDITSIGVSTVSEKPKNADAEGKKVEEIDTEKVVLVVPGDKISFAFTPDDESEKSIQGMKTLLRERKRA